jgi:predicted Zn-dependent peptidase
MRGRRALGFGLALALALPTLAEAQPAGVTRYVLPNRMPVLVRESGGAGVVAVSLQVRAGSRFETAETAGITNFLHRAMLRGTGRRTGEQLVEAAERLGGNLDASGEVEYAEVRGSALARHWEALLGLVAEVALTPTLPADEVEKERRLILSQIQTREDNPFPLAFDSLLRELYGPHPYGLRSLGRRDSVAGLGREDLLTHHRSIYRPDRLVLAVSGRIERDRVKRAAEQLFGRLRVVAEPRVDAAPAPAPTGARRVLERPAQQAQILVGYLAPGLGEPDYPAVKVLAALLGGGMSGRLFVELRDNRGLAYQVTALSPPRAGPGFLVAYMGTARENIPAAEAGMLRELERIPLEGVGEEEVARAKAHVLGSLAMDRRTSARHAWYLAFFEVVGAGWDFPERYARAVETVTAADVRAVAGRYLRRPTTVVLEPR